MPNRLTQGSIISGCTAASYSDVVVWGCVITPRCDLSHGIKVPTIHYLPVVSFEDWLKVDGNLILKTRKLKEINKTLNGALRDIVGVDNITESNLDKESIYQIVEEKVPEEKKSSILGFAQQYYGDAELDPFSKKDYKGVIKDLLRGDLHGFYCVEDWNVSGIEASGYKIIILRDVRPMSKSFALELNHGFIEDEYDHSELERNNFATSVKKETIYDVVTEIQSPYIEHILQAFSHNFTRIGVQDIDPMTKERLFNFCTK